MKLFKRKLKMNTLELLELLYKNAKPEEINQIEVDCILEHFKYSDQDILSRLKT